MPRQKSTHVDDPLLVGERLRAAREQAGLSQRGLSFPGCSPAYISRVESGDRIPSLQLLRELGRRLGVSEDWLATGSEEPGAPGGALLEADVALRLGQLDLAEAVYAALLDGESSRAEAHAGLGRIALAQGNPRKAIEHFESSLELFGDDASAHPDLAEPLGQALALIGDIAAARAVFERSVEQAERNEDTLERARFEVLLGESLLRAGDGDRAVALLGSALEETDGETDLDTAAERYWDQSRALARRKELRAAGRYALRALELLHAADDDRRTGRAYRLLAAAETDRGRPERALALLEKGRPLLQAGRNEPELVRYRLEEARASAALGRTEEAARLAHEVAGAIDGPPEDAARCYVRLAEIFENLGDRRRALELSERAADRLLKSSEPSPFQLELYNRLARLYEAEGRQTDAYEALKKELGHRQATHP